MTERDVLKEMFTLTRRQTMELLKELDESGGLEKTPLTWQPAEGSPNAAWLTGRIGKLTQEVVRKVRKGFDLPSLRVTRPEGHYGSHSKPSQAADDGKALVRYVRDTGIAMTKTLEQIKPEAINKAPNPKHPHLTVAKRLMKLILQEAGLRGQLELISKLYATRPQKTGQTPEPDAESVYMLVEVDQTDRTSQYVALDDVGAVQVGRRDARAGRHVANREQADKLLKQPTEFYFDGDANDLAEAEADDEEPDSVPIVRPIDEAEEHEKRPSRELPGVEEADPPELHDL